MTEKRRFFVVGWNTNLDYAMYCDSEPAESVTHWLELIPQALNTQAASEEDKVQTLKPGETCLLYDWNLNVLPPDIRASQIPKPGVVFAVRMGAHLQVEDATTDANQGSGDNTEASGAKPEDADTQAMGGEFALTYALKRELWRGESRYAKRLQAFLVAPEASYDPLPITRYDVFISYGGDDIALATEIASDIEAKSMRTFLASRDLTAGMMWAEEVRQALLASRVLLILLTPNSASRPWVMCEVGASWALGKPLIPALLYVDPKSLPEVITAYQCRRIETIQGRKTLVQELADFCLTGISTSL